MRDIVRFRFTPARPLHRMSNGAARSSSPALERFGKRRGPDPAFQ
jgi:hypothetical protein